MHKVKRLYLLLVIIGSAFVFVACGGSKNGDDDYDAAVDMDADVDTDADVDADGDIDVDGAVDAGEDVDGEVDVCDTIADVRAAATGASNLDVDFKLCDVVVTYVAERIFFVQESSTGPAIQVYEQADWEPDVSVGDVISMQVNRVDEHQGNQQITARSALTVSSTGFDVASWVQDLSTGIEPSESLEAELVRISGATVTTVSGRNLTVSYGTASDVVIRVPDGSPFCVGAVFDITAPVTEWSPDSIHRVESYLPGDITGLDVAPCWEDNCDTIADVRAAATGASNLDVNFKLCDVVVTYVAERRFFLQEGPTGPAIQVYEQAGWVPDVTVGDVISLQVNRVNEYQGNQEISGRSALTVVSTGFDVPSWVQDLSAGIEPSESLEAELVRISGATVTDISGLNLTVSYGTALDVVIRVLDAAPFCVGAVFDITAPVTEWLPASLHRVQSYLPDDITNLDDSGCGP